MLNTPIPNPVEPPAIKGWCLEHTNPHSRVSSCHQGGFVERTTLQNFLFCDLAPKTLNLDRGTAEALNHKRGRAHEGAYARTYSTARSAVRELNEIARNLSRPSRLSPSKSFDIL